MDETTDTPTDEATDAPTQAPAGETTQTPGGDPTATPTEAPAPADEVVENETPEPTEEPTPEPSREPLKLSSLSASQQEVAPGQKVRVSFEVENADTVLWSAQRSDGMFVSSGAVKKDEFSWTPEASGVYTITVNATAGDITASESCRVVVRKGELKAKAQAATDYARVDGEKLEYNLQVSGGCEP